MIPMAAAACEAVAHLTDVPQAEDLLREGIAAARRIQNAYREWFTGGRPPAHSKEEQDLYHHTLDTNRTALHQLERPFLGRGQKLSVGHARDAILHFLRGNSRHRSDTESDMAESIFNAIYALAFACDEEKGVRPSRGMRMRRDWNDRYGYRPSRGCVTKANRVMKRVMLEPALLAIAGELVRGPSL
jgi:hypothetical protein